MSAPSFSNLLGAVAIGFLAPLALAFIAGGLLGRGHPGQAARP